MNFGNRCLDGSILRFARFVDDVIDQSQEKREAVQSLLSIVLLDDDIKNLLDSG